MGEHLAAGPRSRPVGASLGGAVADSAPDGVSGVDGADRPHLLGMLPADLLAWMQQNSVPGGITEARKVLGHLVSTGEPHLSSMRLPVSKALSVAVHSRLDHQRLEILERFVDPADKSVRYLFRHPDGATSEAVRIPLHKAGRYSVCLSSQVGCAMRCAFCATGRLGLQRNLAAWEMVAAFMTVRDEVRAENGGRVTGAVFMGQGEPLHNYGAVIRAAQILSDPCGGRISADAITISTVGLVPRIRQYTAEGHKFRLIVSLSSAIAERREGLLPIAGKWSLEELAEALREHQAAAGGRMTVAWVLMSGVNTGPEEAEALARLLGDVPLRVNLIDVNDARPDGFRRAPDAERKAFMDALQVLRAPVVRRYSVGQDQRSACGMLASTWTPPTAEEPA